MTQAPAFTTWLDHFFASYYKNRPVNATFIGRHEYDSALPDFSQQGVGDTLAEMEGMLAQLRQLPEEKYTSAEEIDRALAEGFLRIQIWEYQSNHFHRRNPCVYTGEAIFGVIVLFLTNFAPVSERVESAIQRMERIPVLLAQGQANVLQAPAAWVERATRECAGALIFLRSGIERLIHDEQISDPRFRSAADRAAEAFATFDKYLKTEIRPLQNGDACGETAFDLMMRQGHFITMSGDEVVRYAETQMTEAEAYLDAHATDFGATNRQAALAQLADLHPTADQYLARFSELWHKCREMVEAHALLTWRDFPIQYTPRPAWAREAAPYLYFLPYRAPAAMDRPSPHYYLVPPLDPSLPAADQEKFLRATNDSVIKLNHVIHHGSIGHHMQNWNAYHAASRIGQIAAVDCASRIAMFCGGTMAEGWACYATGLMSEVGFLTPLEEYSEHQARLRMSARAIVDIRLHQGRMTIDDAATFYEQRAAMGRDAAVAESVKNSMFPGAAMMYLIGTDRIRELRRDLSARPGSRFDLRQFHDKFLAFGSIPVELIAREMQSDSENAK